MLKLILYQEEGEPSAMAMKLVGKLKNKKKARQKYKQMDDQVSNLSLLVEGFPSLCMLLLILTSGVGYLCDYLLEGSTYFYF